MKESNKEFVPYELALKLKELGFNKDCFGYYSSDKELNLFGEYPLLEMMEHTNNTLSIAPLWQQAFEWVREKYGYLYLITDIKLDASDTSDYRFNYQAWKIENDDFYIDGDSVIGYSSYEEAQQACLKAIIEDLTKTNNSGNKG